MHDYLVAFLSIPSSNMVSTTLQFPNFQLHISRFFIGSVETDNNKDLVIFL